MASVRLTRDVRAAIVENTKAMFEDRITKLREKITPDIDLKEAYMEYLAPYKEALAAVPQEFIKTVSTVEIRFAHSNQSQFESADTYEYRRSLVHTTRFDDPVPATSTSYSAELTIINDKVFEYLYTAKKALLQATKERDDLTREVQTAVGQCNTLGQLLKAWPQAEHVVPQYLMDKLNEKNVRIKPEGRIAPEISASLSTQLLSAKMQNSAMQG